ncbi:MAG TPA: hypothetical protein VHN37_05010 [Actinomycetota bacterium]|nr:hypothetical protein [Actinomycetota bacterium]
MSQVVTCPDCGTQNRADADLCVQCWREMSAGAVERIPVAAFAVAAPAAPPFPVAPPRRVPAPRPAPDPVKPREAEAGPVPYFVPVGSTSVPGGGFPLPATPAPTTETTTAFPWGRLIALGLVLALLGGGYYFFFGRSSGAFSPEDGSYSVELPEGWTPIDDVTAAQPQIDAAVRSESDQSAIMVGHQETPTPMTREQMRAGMSFVQQLMPQLPGMQFGAFRDSTVVSGDGLFAFEMTLEVSGGGMLPGADGQGRMRMVFVGEEGGSTAAFLLVACAEAECPTAEATFQEMARTFEFS